MEYLEESINLLSSIPFYKDAAALVKDPRNIQGIIKKNPKLATTANKLVSSASQNPAGTLKTYTNSLNNQLEEAKDNIGRDKFFNKVVAKNYLDVSSYSEYLYYLLRKETKMNDLSAVITTIMCSSVGVFWTILTLGRYKFSKQLAERLVDRIKRRGLVLQTFLTLGTIVFQVGLVVLMQAIVGIGGTLWALKSKKVIKILASLLYIFIATITALIMISKSGYGAIETREYLKTHSSS